MLFVVHLILNDDENQRATRRLVGDLVPQATRLNVRHGE